MTTERKDVQGRSSATGGAQNSPSPLLANLDALRSENDRLGIDRRDSTVILRELRERFAR